MMIIGVGAVYCYDAIGSYERENYRANGSAAALIQPFLDNQVWISINVYVESFTDMIES